MRNKDSLLSTDKSEADSETKPVRKTGFQSLQFKASFLVVLLILAVAVTSMILSLRTMSSVLYENQIHQAREWATALASNASNMAMNKGLFITRNLRPLTSSGFLTGPPRVTIFRKVLSASDNPLIPCFSRLFISSCPIAPPNNLLADSMLLKIKGKSVTMDVGSQALSGALAVILRSTSPNFKPSRSSLSAPSCPAG